MNIQIKKQLIVGFAALSMLALGSCHGDLDRMPTNVTTATQVYSTPEGIKQAIAKVYGTYSMPGNDVVGQNSDFTDFYRSFFNLQELPTDEAICAWSDDGIRDFHNLNWNSSNPYIKGLYYRSIAQIKLANEFLTNTNDKASDATVATYRAEARFLRAFQYWVLMDLYGNPPFIAEDLGVGLVFPKQIQRKDLFTYVETELKELETLLPEPKTNEYGRADRAAAWALLARLYLNAGVYTGTARYADAASYAERVITSNKYSLAPVYANNFLTDNASSPETILSINYDGINSQAYGGMTFIINASTNGDASKELRVDWGAGGWGGNRATESLYKLFEANDNRRLMGATTPSIDDVSKFVQGVWVYKFRNVSSTGAKGQHETFADTDLPLFRLAEMHLIYAEAAARGAADKAKGLQYINALRKRASATELTLAQLTEREVLDERGRELYWEGHRRTDLVRYDLLTSGTYLWDWKGNAPAGTSVDAKYNLYPLPADDVQANIQNLKQNTGY
ncbi:MAG: RagB/SusD family nutrient uptake outer membrane protein [Porphyromonas sp.]|nr:RagB/SusD family nutrient uptake outer membrane protein [Porphyromonas sp.]